MILAKDTDAQRKFSEYFEKGQVRNIYPALITGSPSEKTGTIDAPLSPSRKNLQIMEVDLKNGKDARTKWELAADYGSISLIAARPQTGRTHQIRVHLQYAGMPLAIDPLYGQNSAFSETSPTGGQAIMLSSFKADYKCRKASAVRHPRADPSGLGKHEEEKPLTDRLTLCAYELEIENLHPVRDKASGLTAFIKEENFSRLLDSKPLLLQI